jgi:aminocarboxymuconate-semialdehyde decarboxylase
MKPTSSNTRINCHAHVLPYAHEIPRWMRDKKIFWINDAGTHMCQGDWSRPITHESFFVNEKIAWMDNHNIDQAVVINLSQLYCNGYDEQISHDVIRFQNDFNASLQVDHGSRFIGGFVVQPRYIDQSLREIERCVAHYQMPVLCLPTHYIGNNGQWTSIADEHTRPIFELANKYKLAVEIHPYGADEMVNLSDTYWRFHLIWMCAQTADAYHMYTMMDFDRKYNDLRVCFAHGNQFGQVGLGRRSQGYQGRPDLFVGASDPSEHLGAKNIYFDSLVHDVWSLDLMLRRQSHTQIVCGLDDPYPLGEMETVPGCYPGKLLDDAEATGVLTTAQKNDIWHANALSWIYG